MTCGDVVRSGLVAPVPNESFSKASAADRVARANARKRGRTQPMAGFPAKRLCTFGSLAYAADVAKRTLIGDASSLLVAEPLPENVLDWRSLRPTKRLRTKASPDALLIKGELAI